MLILSCIILQNGRIYFKNLEGWTSQGFYYVWAFFNIILKRLIILYQTSNFFQVKWNHDLFYFSFIRFYFISIAASVKMVAYLINCIQILTQILWNNRKKSMLGSLFITIKFLNLLWKICCRFLFLKIWFCFWQGFKGLHKTFWGTPNKCENKNFS